jgi:hypothetical protein
MPEIGTYQIIVRASDGELFDEQTVNIIVPGMWLGVTQEYVEALAKQAPTFRFTQEYVEALCKVTKTHTITQEYVEALTKVPPTFRVSAEYVEVLCIV